MRPDAGADQHRPGRAAEEGQDGILSLSIFVGTSGFHAAGGRHVLDAGRKLSCDSGKCDLKFVGSDFPVLTWRQFMPINRDTGSATFALHAMLMEGARISWEVPHAVQRLVERDVTAFEAERVIRTGNVVRIDAPSEDDIRWRIAGWDADDRPIHVVVAPIGDDVLRVVTVIRTDE